jgi:hypothetical protein
MPRPTHTGPGVHPHQEIHGLQPHGQGRFRCNMEENNPTQGSQLWDISKGDLVTGTLLIRSQAPCHWASWPFSYEI